ncbi:hypothetical protein [Nocardioides coralli]|uniref:hypothetical protein n=1 Tax=Nocardioides coralli TaxID=2872154 RepID=UPI001CA40803|nr:hypothetical protein [Nocardioides coralli]QZY28454.1 hypothetical protein K6T13_13405 [Nocardioides coralli]
MTEERTLAHGLGGQQDLPIPAELAIAGAVAALVVSFTVLAVAWRKPRYDATTSGRPAPDWLARLVDHPAYAIALRAIGVLFLGWFGLAAIFGRDLLTNPVFGMFYVWWWVGLVPLSVLLGPVWRAISPVRTINDVFARLSGSDPARGLYRYPTWLGHWPAALGLFSFVWMELVYPFGTELGPVRLWVAVYVAAMLVGGALFGTTFFERADPFEVYSSLCAKLSPWGRREGRLVVRSPLANLDTLEPQPGIVAVVGVLLGSTAFDSFRDSLAWIRFTQDTSVSTYLLNNLALLAFCAAVALIIAGASVATRVEAAGRWELPGLLAHSVVPIIVGYIVAHYVNYLLEVGWDTLVLASDPLGTGADWLGTADLDRITWLSYNPTLLASIKVLAVVVGHVVAVVAAHDRSIKVLPEKHQLTGQLPMLFAMISFTVGGLYLLFAA